MQSGNPISSDVRHRRFRVGAFVILTAVLVFASITESDSQATVVRAADRASVSTDAAAAEPEPQAEPSEQASERSEQASQDPPSVSVGDISSTGAATEGLTRADEATTATTEVYVAAGPAVLGVDPAITTADAVTTVIPQADDVAATCEMPSSSDEAGPAGTTATTDTDGTAAAPQSAEDEAPSIPDRVGQAIHADTFDVLTPSWQGLAGSWSVNNARLVQSDANGYDLLIEYDQTPPSAYRVSVDMVALDTPLGGGLMIAQPTPMTRNGAFIVDFTEGGAFLRWGKYDNETGQYRYMGGVATPEGFDPTAPHTLAVEQDTITSRVLIDGVTVADFAPLPPGRTGLVTSVSSVAFDNFTIENLTNDED